MVEISSSHVRPEGAVGARLRRPLAVAASMLAMIIASAYVSVPLPLSPVPMTMQSLAVLMAGIWAGPRAGAAVCIAYLALGMSGLPVFAGGASAPGLVLFSRPSAGYLFAFVPAAWVAGVLCRTVGNRALGGALALAAGHAVIFAGGVGYLMAFVPASHAVAIGFAPFILGSLVKILLGTALVAITPRKRA